MANIAHLLRIPEADSGRAAPTGRGWGGISLVAERANWVADLAGPVSSPLFARASVPTGALPRACDLVPERTATPPLRGSRRAIVAAVLAALALHFLVIAPLIPLSAPAPDDESTQRLGMETGQPLNVSVISADDLKRLNSNPSKVGEPEPAQPAPPQPDMEAEPTPPQEAQQPSPQQEQKPEPSTEQQKAASASPLESKSEKERPFDLESYIANFMKPARPDREAEQKSAAREAQPQRKVTRAGRVSGYRPGATSSGKSNEFERAVIWALGATTPMGNGKWGNVIVTFAVGDAGRVDGLRLIKSSGDNWLDQGALMAVRQAKLPVPPSGLTVGDRTFVVEYISTPKL
ncbi:energy transducer TonB family protein [Rhodomicrobium lacus]|uniref:energy transducer TonB family protein n=1 Tax=Rhodomicrobium lacus TaxID=2498452 RepID=UPI0026E2AF07|nr:TonB family protein [Rhodomicrobium lacus]WKW52236.1 TonB family protein [Rhodomicrobium lacus]